MEFVNDEKRKQNTAGTYKTTETERKNTILNVQYNTQTRIYIIHERKKIALPPFDLSFDVRMKLT